MGRIPRILIVEKITWFRASFENAGGAFKPLVVPPDQWYGYFYKSKTVHEKVKEPREIESDKKTK
jgi:hypothetical protein